MRSSTIRGPGRSWKLSSKKQSLKAANPWTRTACDLAHDANLWQAFAQLTSVHQAAAKRAFRLFTQDPAHNSLQFKKLQGHADYWSVRVTLDVRAVGKRQGDIIEWVWVGTHNDFDKLFG